jgi:hypothetical protein
MGKYGDAAVLAANLYREGMAPSPNHAWESAVEKIFPLSKSSQEKGCPRGTFLGLCETGAIFGIPHGNYCRSIKNKKYALKALKLLKNNPSLSEDVKVLWDLVMEGEQKVPNHQMDVVSSIWNAGLVRGNLSALA